MNAPMGQNANSPKYSIEELTAASIDNFLKLESTPA